MATKFQTVRKKNQDVIKSVARSARQLNHAMQILNHHHYSFLWKLIVSTVCKHDNIGIA